MRSSPVVVDLTAPVGGWVHDVVVEEEDIGYILSNGTLFLPDIDFGNAELRRFQAHWGGWEDLETPDLMVHWAIMRVDPREMHISNSIANPGSELASIVQRYLDANPDLFAVDAPTRPYQSFQGAQLHEVDNGVMITPFFAPDATGFGDHVDVELLTGFVYYSIVRVTNGHGLATIASSDGVVFDDADPCMSQPHAGSDPMHQPQVLNMQHAVAAVWGAKVDPRFQLDGPFECSRPVGENATAEGVHHEAIAPLWRMEWQVRRSLPTNSTLNTTIPDTLVGSTSDVDGVDVSANISALNSTIDVSGGQIDLNATTVSDQESWQVVVPPTQVGGNIASPWSACCSSYGEFDPQTIREEWDWRPTQVQERFGHDVAMAKSRFVGVAGRGFATVFDMLSAESIQHRVTAEELHEAAGSSLIDADGFLVHVAAHQMFVFATPLALSITTTPPELAHALDEDAAGATSSTMTVLASLSPTSPLLSGSIDGSVFTTTSLTGGIATRGDLVAITTSGVWQGAAARSVVVLRVAGDGSTTRVGAVASPDASFGEAITLVRASEYPTVSGTLLVVSTPASCVQPQPSVNYTRPCGGSTATTPVLRTYAVGVSMLTSQQSVSAPGAANPSPAFGTALAGAGNFIVVGDPESDSSTGEVTVMRVTSTGGITPVCSMPGLLDNGGFGFSVSISDAEEEGKTGARSQGRNDNTALVLAGAPGGNAAIVIRVNLSHTVPCKIVAVARQSLFFRREGEVVPPLYGAGTAVAVGGGMIVFSSPFAHTWPHTTEAAVGESMAGTGRVFGASFCWAGDVRSSSLASASNLPTVCLPCGADDHVSEWSSGGTSGSCEACTDVQCVDNSESLFASQAAVDLELNQRYMIDVTAVSQSGRSATHSSPLFSVDWTPPEAGHVRDALQFNLYNISTTRDIEVQTNATYLAASWCCFVDTESSITGYHVGFGTSPGTMDIVDFTPAGNQTSFVVNDLVLATGQHYYACVLASNEVGLFSDPVCSNGFVYDDTPPTMLSVRDGFQQGYDADAQSFLDILYANFEAHDPETHISEYVLSFGRTPGASDVAADLSAGNYTMNGVFLSPFISVPERGDVIYATVVAINDVGLVSASMTSDGITMGKSDVLATPTSETSMLMDTLAVAAGVNATYDPPTTVAGVAIPPGAVSQEMTFFGGAVTEGDIGAGDAVNASETMPRNVRSTWAICGCDMLTCHVSLQNLRFGDYSFTLEARDPDTGDVISPFSFDIPVRVSMMCTCVTWLRG